MTSTVLPTALANADKVREEFAPVLMQDSLRNTLRGADFDTPATAPIERTSCFMSCRLVAQRNEY